MGNLPLSPDSIRSIALEMGFDLVQVSAPPTPANTATTSCAGSRQAGMARCTTSPRIATASSPQPPGDRRHSAIALRAVDYGGPAGELPGGGRVARYAVGRDYHRWLRERVFTLRQRLEAAGVPYGSMNGGTDAVPVLERALAARAGIGFLAKSAMVISPTHGPYLQLAELLTGMELPPDQPAPGSCGTCTACLTACPTQAIVAPFEVDARRCLSYTTIELRGFAAPKGARSRANGCLAAMSASRSARSRAGASVAMCSASTAQTNCNRIASCRPGRSSMS